MCMHPTNYCLLMSFVMANSIFLKATDSQAAVALNSPSGTSNCTQLNTQQLNKGGRHLNQQGLGGPQTGRTLYSHTF